ncbi:hypothetical protein Nmel_011353 [Mimus melanotis]
MLGPTPPSLQPRPPSNRRHSCAGKQETPTPQLPPDPKTPTPRQANDSFPKTPAAPRAWGRVAARMGGSSPVPLPACLRRVHLNASHAERSPPPLR